MKAFVVHTRPGPCWSEEESRILFIVMASELEEAKKKAAHELGIAELTNRTTMNDLDYHHEPLIKYPVGYENPEDVYIEIEEVPVLTT
jgi:hypothetical protein